MVHAPVSAASSPRDPPPPLLNAQGGGLVVPERKAGALGGVTCRSHGFSAPIRMVLSSRPAFVLVRRYFQAALFTSAHTYMQAARIYLLSEDLPRVLLLGGCDGSACVVDGTVTYRSVTSGPCLHSV